MGRLDIKLRIQSEHKRKKIEKWREELNKFPAANSNNSNNSNKMKSTSLGSSSDENREKPKPPMDHELYRATIEGDVDNFMETMIRISTEKGKTYSEILDQVSPLQNTYLHVASMFGHHNLVRLIIDPLPTLLTVTNSKGDTPLHLAVRAGHRKTALVLLLCPGPSSSSSSSSSSAAAAASQKRVEMLRMRNKEGNTALHEAMMRHEIFNSLWKDLMEDPEVLGYENNNGKSPLYLAVEGGDVQQVELMLDSYGCEAPKGKSPVHAAIRARNQGLLETILGKVPSFIHLKDEEGGTPLHCAASIGYFEGVQYLLDKNSESVLERDESGFMPIHNASRKGHVDIVQKLCRHYPDWRELLTKEGQNILHVAAERGKGKVVNHIVKTPWLKDLANERDESGNTPLHLATMNWHPRVVSSLTWGKEIDLNLVNKVGMTPLDIAEEPTDMPPPFRKVLTNYFWLSLPLRTIERGPFFFWINFLGSWKYYS